MDTFGTLFEEVNKNAPRGMQVEVARKTTTGQTVPAKPQELATLSTKSRIASTAHLLKNLSKEEKLQWALDTKEEANQLYREKRFAEAMEKYVETLTATNFGNKQPTSDDSQPMNILNGEVSEYDESGNKKDSLKQDISTSEDNIDTLVVPVLCNLTACCIELQQWAKAMLFVDQILPLRPLCRKAHYRRGVALLHLHEYSLSIKSLETALETLSEDKLSPLQECMPLTDTERVKVKYFLQKAIEARKKEMNALDKRKLALQKAFGGSSSSNNKLGANVSMMSVERQINEDGEETLILHPPSSTTDGNENDNHNIDNIIKDKEKGMSLGMLLIVMVRYFLEQFFFLCLWMLGITLTETWVQNYRHWFVSTPFPTKKNDTQPIIVDPITTQNNMQDID